MGLHAGAVTRANRGANRSDSATDNGPDRESDGEPNSAPDTLRLRDNMQCLHGSIIGVGWRPVPLVHGWAPSVECVVVPSGHGLRE